MRVSSVILVVLAVLCAGVTAPVAAAGGSPGGSPAAASAAVPATTQAEAPLVAQQETPNGTNETTDEGAGESAAGDESAGFGSQISSFMQSSSTQTTGAVESRMWQVRANRSGGSLSTANVGVSAPAVERRVSILEARLAELRETRERLAEARANGSLSRVEYRARLARVNGQLSALGSAVDRTRPVAVEAGFNETRLAELGAEIEAERGPPPWAENRSAGGTAGDGNGPPEGGDGAVGPGAGNGSAGNGNGADGERGNSGNGNDDAGNGNGNANAGNGDNGNGNGR